MLHTIIIHHSILRVRVRVTVTHWVDLMVLFVTNEPLIELILGLN